MKKKAKIINKKTTYIGKNVSFGKNVIIYPNNYILGNTFIGDNCVILPNNYIEDCNIGENCRILYSVLEKSTVDNETTIGPFSHLRPNCKIGKSCKIGNFVEIKNSTLDKGTKVSHLSYIGDAEVGTSCNIGCGVIFVNYNGKDKNRIKVGDGCFIGSNANLIAPLKLAKRTYICAGTTVTENSKEEDFIIGRVKPTIKENRANKYLKEKI